MIAFSVLIWLAPRSETGNVVFAATTPLFVQEKDREVTSGTTDAVTLASPSAAGNLLVVYVIWDRPVGVSISDTAGNTYASAVGPTLWSGKYSAQVFYARQIKGGADTVTATFASAVTSFGIVYVHEYAGISAVNPVDVTAAASGSSASLNSGSATTTGANDLIFGAGVSDNRVTAAGSGFTARSFTSGNITEDRIAGSVGSYSATATHNGKAWAMQMVAFRAASADTTPPTAPTKLSAVPLSFSQINLAWTASTDPDNASTQLIYNVYRNAVRIGATAAGVTSWQDTGLAAASTYTYAVGAQDPAGNSSAQSTSVQATTPVPLPAIISFTASPASIITGQLSTLSWTVSNATSLHCCPN